jgi:hypothetical protein
MLFRSRAEGTVDLDGKETTKQHDA